MDDGSHVQSLQKAEDGVDVPDQADSSEDATPPPLAMENSWADPGASPAGMHNLRNHQNDGGNMAASLSSLTTSSGLDREIVRQLPRMVQEENQAMLRTLFLSLRAILFRSVLVLFRVKLFLISSVLSVLQQVY